MKKRHAGFRTEGKKLKRRGSKTPNLTEGVLLSISYLVGISFLIA